MKIKRTPIKATRGYWADDLNADNNAKILQTLMDSLYEDIDGQKIGDVEISVGDKIKKQIDKTITQGAYKFTIGFFPQNYLNDASLEVISRPDSRGKFYCRLKYGDGRKDEFYIPMSGSRQKLKDKIAEIAESIKGEVNSSMKITRRAIKADTLADGRQVSEGSLRLDVIENKLKDMIGKPVSQAANFLAKYGFENTELNGQDGYRKTSGIDSYDTWAGYENNEGYYVKLYYTMERDHKRGGNRFTWGILTDFHVDKYDVTASSDVKRKSVKASRAIMAGAGSGITLELADLDFTEVPDGGFYAEYNEYHDFLEPENGWCKGTIQIKSIGTYYEGGNPGMGDIPVSIQVAEVIPDDADDAQALIGGSLKSVVDDIYEIEDKVQIGGGWTRSTFTGEFETEAFTSDATLKLKVKIEDKGIAEWLDKFAHGESEEIFFDIAINDNPNGSYYESQEDAIEIAKEYAADPQYADDEITVVLEHYSTDYNGEIVDYFDDNGDVVWRSTEGIEESTEVGKTPIDAAWSEDRSAFEEIYRNRHAYIQQFQEASSGEPDTSWDNVFENSVDEFMRYCEDEASTDESGKTLMEKYNAGEITGSDLDDYYDDWIMWTELSDFDI
jgi:hypothetical protein